ncbi:importin beta-1 subunit [Leishmania donovani]|uniref:Importin_beta-1_subunit_-_putative n=3 Tax=Leishmania donovani species complex TaxID=38574 RepID=A0A6L0XPX9_LEIIN|nr:putative importin beta-1 subunit [Leishmania infantum JPCM5]CAC9536309.1 importin_beta-1_subunit_-_putative [Leishmania infantum]CAJ1992384.1 importin beta-1 subunit [Leishmania donovani]CAM71522.1 putative importin beta-1 subunit [Leishmania infantum JPCM5]SUZ45411.1 importin_beta-1_subunit_-_putative [Leishmania infantum]VDZ48219.1 importin_beta-1_subunit_putative/GeneDB:LmjF.34.0490 [Leishmania donovani]|eukprot:XP_001468438.1 putative importin beta-1 subunit [Leishmania infantum JPCM5]
MANITDLLMALGNPEPSIRVPAETAVNNAKETDLATFMTTMLQEFRDESKPTFARNMAGTLLKNAVAPSFREVAARHALEERWRALPADVRLHIKNEVLSTLGSPNRDVRTVAANIVGSLARSELPSGEWPQLMGILVGAAQSASEQHQEAALTAIGYICEEGKDHEEVEGALKPSTTDVLSVIVQCMASTNEDVKLSATNALCNAMEYIHDNMDVPEQRSYLVTALCETAKSCTTARTRERAMESLVKVAELYYSTLPDYIARLHEITTNAIFHDEEAVGLQAIQFWISICELERDMKEGGDVQSSLNYSAQGLTFLVDICKQLLVQQEEDQTEDDWNLSVAGGKLLQSLAEAVGIPIQRPVMDFVYANINSTEWRKREASVMAFGCIIGVQETAAQEAIQDTVAQAVPGLMEYLRDSNEMVADTSAWVLALVCENFVDIFLQTPDLLQRLMNDVGPMIGGENARMGVRACHIINNIALAYEEEEDQQTNEISRYYGDLVVVLLHAIDHGTTNDFKSAAQETLNALVDAAANDCCSAYLIQLPQELLARMGPQLNALRQSSGDNIEAEAMMGLLCGALSALARKLGQSFMPFLDASMQALIQVIELPTDYVQQEALVAIGSIAYVAKEQLAPYLAKVIPHVLKYLQAFDEPDSIYGVVAAVGDLSLSCRLSLLPFESDIMNTLYVNLTNTEVDRELKCSFLSCFSDFILNVLGSERFKPYMAALLPLVDRLFRASCEIDIRGDPEGEEYVMSLWETTASFYSSVTQCFKSSDVDALAPYLANILNFALHAATNAGEFEETQMAALMVIGDMASVLRHVPDPQMRAQAKQALLADAVNGALNQALCSSTSEDNKKQIKWIRNQLSHLQRS